MYLNPISLENTRAFFLYYELLNHLWKASLEDNQHRGRPSYSVLPFLHAALAKRYFKIVATSDLRARLLSDANLKQICGFENIPSAAGFSRYMSYLADNVSLEESLGEMVKDYYEGQLVNNVARDSTAISAREKPVNAIYYGQCL